VRVARADVCDDAGEVRCIRHVALDGDEAAVLLRGDQSVRPTRARVQAYCMLLRRALEHIEPAAHHVYGRSAVLQGRGHHEPETYGLRSASGPVYRRGDCRRSAALHVPVPPPVMTATTPCTLNRFGALESMGGESWATRCRERKGTLSLSPSDDGAFIYGGGG
jgi:hypothetical protein